MLDPEIRALAVQSLVGEIIRGDVKPRMTVLTLHDAYGRISGQATAMWNVLSLVDGSRRDEMMRDELIKTLILSCYCLFDLGLIVPEVKPDPNGG